MRISHNAPVESQNVPSSASLFWRSLTPVAMKTAAPPLLHIPNVYRDGQEVAREECAKSRSSEMSRRRFPFPSSSWPLDRDVVTFQLFFWQDTLSSRAEEKWPWGRKGGVSGLRHEGGKVLIRRRWGLGRRSWIKIGLRPLRCWLRDTNWI